MFYLDKFDDYGCVLYFIEYNGVFGMIEENNDVFDENSNTPA